MRFGNLSEGKPGILANGEVPDRGAKLDQMAVGERTILSRKRPPKLLVASF